MNFKVVVPRHLWMFFSIGEYLYFLLKPLSIIAWPYVSNSKKLVLDLEIRIGKIALTWHQAYSLKNSVELMKADIFTKTRGYFIPIMLLISLVDDINGLPT